MLKRTLPFLAFAAPAFQLDAHHSLFGVPGWHTACNASPSGLCPSLGVSRSDACRLLACQELPEFLFGCSEGAWRAGVFGRRLARMLFPCTAVTDPPFFGDRAGFLWDNKA